MRRRSTGATRSGLIGNSSACRLSSDGEPDSPVCIVSSRSGSTASESVSMVAEPAMAAAMISPWVRSACIRVSIRPSRNWFR
jgi:hypothetical protein